MALSSAELHRKNGDHRTLKAASFLMLSWKKQTYSWSGKWNLAEIYLSGLEAADLAVWGHFRSFQRKHTNISGLIPYTSTVVLSIVKFKPWMNGKCFLYYYYNFIFVTHIWNFNKKYYLKILRVVLLFFGRPIVCFNKLNAIMADDYCKLHGYFYINTRRWNNETKPFLNLL